MMVMQLDCAALPFKLAKGLRRILMLRVTSTDSATTFCSSASSPR